MFEEILSELNPHWIKSPDQKGVERSCFPRLLEYLATGQVTAVTGVRRAGKSTLIKQLITHLIRKEKVAAKNILFFNLEHPYLSRFRDDVATLQELYEDYRKLMQPDEKHFVFLDEVQFFRDWPVFVKSHHEQGKITFVITGSNAAMLSTDMVTLLSGRSLTIEVFPFSLREFALSRGLDVSSSLQLAANTPKWRRLFDEFLEYGGFPTVACRDKDQTAFDILGEHARTVLLQDVVPRLGARKPADLEQLYVYLVSNIGKLFSYHGLSSLFGIADKSIKEYISALSDAHLLYELDVFSFSLKKQVRTPKKIYAIDTGQANAMGFRFSENRGRLLENLIYIDLKRLGFPVYYYKTKNGREVDFVLKKGTEICLLQVCWDLSDAVTLGREVAALEEAAEELKCDRKVLISAEKLPKDKISKSVHSLLAYQFLSLDNQDRRNIFFQ